MAEITLQDIAHSYNPEAADKTYALNRFDMKWVDGGRYAILGPSGCGKTTTLRMIAGLEMATSGQILIGGEDVTRLPATKRDVSMVFQSYALFPHMRVSENIRYGLEVSRIPRDVMEAKTREVMKLMGLEALG